MEPFAALGEVGVEPVARRPRRLARGKGAVGLHEHPGVVPPPALLAAAERAVTDHGGRARRRQVENRGAVHVDSERREVGGDPPGVQRRRLRRGAAVGARRLAEAPRRRRTAPVRRAQAGDAAAFLVDQHRRVGAADGLAERPHQRREPLRRVAVAREDDQPQRIVALEQAPLVVAEDGAGAAEDDGLGRTGRAHGAATKHATLRSRSWRHRLAALSRLGIGPTWRR